MHVYIFVQAGSGLEGGAIPYQGGVALDLTRLKAFELFDEEMQVPGPPYPVIGSDRTGPFKNICCLYIYVLQKGP